MLLSEIISLLLHTPLILSIARDEKEKINLLYFWIVFISFFRMNFKSFFFCHPGQHLYVKGFSTRQHISKIWKTEKDLLNTTEIGEVNKMIYLGN